MEVDFDLEMITSLATAITILYICNYACCLIPWNKVFHKPKVRVIHNTYLEYFPKWMRRSRRGIARNPSLICWYQEHILIKIRNETTELPELWINICNACIIASIWSMVVTSFHRGKPRWVTYPLDSCRLLFVLPWDRPSQKMLSVKSINQSRSLEHNPPIGAIGPPPLKDHLLIGSKTEKKTSFIGSKTYKRTSTSWRWSLYPPAQWISQVDQLSGSPVQPIEAVQLNTQLLTIKLYTDHKSILNLFPNSCGKIDLFSYCYSVWRLHLCLCADTAKLLCR